VNEPRIYYQDADVALYHARAEDVLPTLEAGSVDLILTDPPYRGVKDEPWDRQWPTDALYLSWLGVIADQWRRVLKPNGSLYCFASPQMAARVECLLAERFTVLNSIRWVKENGWHQKADKEELRAYLSPWEAVVFCEQVYADRDADDLSGYGEACRTLHQRVYSPLGRRIARVREAAGLTRSQVEIALGYVSTADPTRGTALCYRWEEGACLPSEHDYCRLLQLCGDTREYESLRREYESLRREYESLRREYESLRRPFARSARARWHDTWDFAPVPPYPGKHPCEKPLTLLSHAISVSTKPGALVLDTFAGSGAVLQAAKNLGRKAIGVESNLAYCAGPARRLRQQVLPLEWEVAAG
jgi:adenine-specific DNA-methyltransferase